MKKIIIVGLWLICSILQAQTLKDSVDLEAFMDGVISTLMEENNIAGATFTLVHDGKIVLKKGYGFSNIEKQLPVDPDKTLFRIGSITKLFVWTSIMKLVSEGKLDLNTDVNTYLKDFKIPEKYNQPITLTHLLTHTPGFEDRILGLFASDSTALLPLGEILKAEMPERVRPPFTQASYSNHGTGIAAYIVEQVSRMSFNDYVEKHFLQPLQMDYATLRQPLPSRLTQYMSEGYKYTSKFEKQNFEYVPLYPVGAASASAASMANLMITYLQHGKLNDYTLIDSATLALMSSEVKRHHSKVNPMRHGFMDLSQNGVTVIGHGGDTFWFHSLMTMLPEQQVGFFLSFNTSTGGGIYLKAFKSFMDRYYPDSIELAKPMVVSKAWLEQFSGEYRVNRFAYTDITKIISLFGRLKVQVADSNRIALISPEETEYYVPIDSTTFRKEFSNDFVGIEKDKNGKVIHAYHGLLAIFALDKVGFLDLSSTHTLLFVVIIIATLITTAYWPMSYWMRRDYVKSTKTKHELPFSSKLIAWTNYLLLLIFILGLTLSLGEPEDIVFGISTSLKVVLLIPLIVIITTIGMLIFSLPVIRSNRYRLRSRLFYVALCLISVLALWQLNYWNFIGFNY